MSPRRTAEQRMSLWFLHRLKLTFDKVIALAHLWSVIGVHGVRIGCGGEYAVSMSVSASWYVA